jgi:glycosyltransferase involved in cell wall biosynthesis
MLRIGRERIEIVPEAAAPVFRPVPDPRARLGRLELPERFLVWVGGLDPPDPRKGVEALAAAVAGGDGAPLVLAGRADERTRRLAAPGRVLLAGRLADEELAALYSAADALVFPSDDEGFGLPPVEALACGTPVAAYAAGALPETLDAAAGAALVEPGDLSALLTAAESLAGSRAEPPARTWDDVARETWAVYERAAA